jgi:hypothetical protein
MTLMEKENIFLKVVIGCCVVLVISEDIGCCHWLWYFAIPLMEMLVLVVVSWEIGGEGG